MFLNDFDKYSIYGLWPTHLSVFDDIRKRAHTPKVLKYVLRNTRNGTDVFTRFLHDLVICPACVLVNLDFSHQTLVSLVRVCICTCVSRVLNVYLMIIFPNTYSTSHLYNIHQKNVFVNAMSPLSERKILFRSVFRYWNWFEHFSLWFCVFLPHKRLEFPKIYCINYTRECS